MGDEYRLTIIRRGGSTYSVEIAYNGEKVKSPRQNLSNLDRNSVNDLISALESIGIRRANDTRVDRIKVIVSGENLR